MILVYIILPGFMKFKGSFFVTQWVKVLNQNCKANCLNPIGQIGFKITAQGPNLIK